MKKDIVYRIDSGACPGREQQASGMPHRGRSRNLRMPGWQHVVKQGGVLPQPWYRRLGEWREQE
ncbi:hypothetical protein Q5741_15510 [Paenibacillus sp. JX-17]|uniref:Transposase n=1 Tax=Paenibacillus lacisoli TaxID=3064525 RepID=A0ABT9CEX5_9BACL|nr:hypothetical protein [Paenibacillus sp. JX-17]MDO7907818.1 hypothetical protein [Paenibacillus sp. JX-17]